MTNILLLCGIAFCAGFVDAAAGGGGLIQLPALLFLLPGLPVATVLGTNKLSSVSGTLAATVQYARRVGIDRRATLPALLPAVLCSLLGAWVVSHVGSDLSRPVVLLLLTCVAVYTICKRDLGVAQAPRLPEKQRQVAGALAGAGLGFYDGFFGPGMGSLTIFSFVSIFGFSFVNASASAKLVNGATNVAAAIMFAATGHIYYAAAVPMAVCNVAGSALGTRLAILKGSRFVRVLFLVVVCVALGRFLYDIF